MKTLIISGIEVLVDDHVVPEGTALAPAQSNWDGLHTFDDCYPTSPALEVRLNAAGNYFEELAKVITEVMSHTEFTVLDIRDGRYSVIESLLSSICACVAGERCPPRAAYDAFRKYGLTFKAGETDSFGWLSGRVVEIATGRTLFFFG